VRKASHRQGGSTWNRSGLRPLVVGCGFIGSRIVEELLDAGVEPLVLTRSRPLPALAERLAPGSLTIGDAGDARQLEPLLDSVDEVIYSAGGLLPAASEREPERDEQLTLAPVRALLSSLRDRSEVGLTYISSGGTVYGEPAEVPVSEEAPTAPLGTYGRLHLACEREIEQARREGGRRSCILRCATVYGENQLPDRGQGAVVTFLHRVARGMPIDLYGGGTTVRDYVYVGDVARIVVALRDEDAPPPVLNVGSGEGTSLLELLRLVEAEVGRAAEVRSHPERGFDVHRIVLDVSLLKGLLDFEPTPLGDGIARTHAWLEAATSKAA
jgi:UDP-glucose 4-epimerase